MVSQKTIQLPLFSRGFHLITDYILAELPELTGIVHVFIQHTSAGLTINENADSTVRIDFETFFNTMTAITLSISSIGRSSFDSRNLSSVPLKNMPLET